MGAIALSWIGYRLLRLPPASPDLSRKKAWFLLAVVCAAGAWLRLDGLGQYYYYYWDEMALYHFMIRCYKELAIWKRAWIEGQSPLYTAWCSIVWSVLPDAGCLTVTRVSNTLMDLAALWGMYLLGREEGGRRGGITAAVLYAISRPVISECFRGIQVETVNFAMVFSLLALIRFLKKPLRRRAFAWAASLAVMAYSYSALRLLLAWFFVLPALVFLFKRRGRPPGWVLRSSVLSVVAGAIVVYGLKNRMWGSPDSWKYDLLGPTPLLILVLAAIIAWGYLFRPSASDGEEPWAAYLAGTLTVWAAITPYWNDPTWARTYGSITLFQDPVMLQSPLNLMTGVWNGFSQTFGVLFMGKGEQGNSMLEWFFGAAFLTAAGAFLARRDRWSTLFVTTAFVGILGHVLTVTPHNARAMPAVVPYLAFIGMVVTRVWESTPRKSWTRWCLLAVLVFLAVWNAQSNRQWFQETWLKRESDYPVGARRIQAAPPANRVYADPWNGHIWITEAIGADPRTFFMLEDQNPVVVGERETPPDVTVLLFPANEKMVKAFRRWYPKAVWSEHRRKPEVDAAPPDLEEVVISASEWTSRPGGPLNLVRMPGEWKRTLFLWNFGLGYGAIWREDRIRDWDQPLSPDSERHVFVVTGNFQAPGTGPYRFSFESSNIITLKVGGRSVVDSRPYGRSVHASGLVYLSAGMNPVECRVYTSLEVRLPDIRVEGPGLPAGYRLGQPEAPPAGR